jgi:hypothetical protein
MSLGETANVGNCSDGGLREAICTSVAAGVVYVAAAGNSTVDASTFVPASYPEVITVSAINDFDGEPGGLAGCLLFIFYCDDALAEYSNFGTVIEVAAPGTEILSTWIAGGYQTSSGTSMAAPHVAGVAALVLAEDPSLSPSLLAEKLKTTGECPDGTPATNGSGDDCAGQGLWTNDPDGIAEPLVNALAAVQEPDLDPDPSIDITSPANGATVSGVVDIAVDATDNDAVVTVDFYVNGILHATDSDGSDGWSTQWDTEELADGLYTLTATAIDTIGQSGTDSVSVSVGTNAQGDWVGSFGADGYLLAAWEGSSDLTLLPPATLTVGQGSRYRWSSNTTNVRALEAPDESQRRAAAFYHATQIRLSLNFATAYTGNLHLYALDWDTTNRRQRITVNDGTTTTVIDLTSAFNNGAWTHTPVTVPAGGTVTITIDRTGGANAVISGIFLGD